MYKILMCSAEVEPFAKTGGLGDVLGALPKALAKAGHEVSVVMPKYKVIPQEYVRQMKLKKYHYVNLGWRQQYCGIFELKQDNVTYYFVDNEYYFNVDSIYTNVDLERFCFYEKAVMSMLTDEDFSFDIVHCHDWQTGLIPAMIKAWGLPQKSVYTIHNLQYQGIFPWDVVRDFLEIPYEYFADGGIEFYGDVNFMKAGIVYSDVTTTVSETYAEEIRYPYFGERLDGLIVAKGNVKGIVNGIDYDLYNPSKNTFIFENYDINTFVEGKAKNKLALQRQLGLNEDKDAMLVGVVGRLGRQKGFELIECVFHDMMRMNVQFVLLGTGDPHYENLFRHYEYTYVGRVSSSIMFNNQLAHKIYAASDLFLMPSLYEPCGLGQIISLSYGAIPLVREVGGLKDTIMPYSDANPEGNGFRFYAYNAHDMLTEIERAAALFTNKKKWNQIIKNAMKCDFSWDNSASKYTELYKEIIG